MITLPAIGVMAEMNSRVQEAWNIYSRMRVAHRAFPREIIEI
jgi:hypothetical protein